ALVRAWLRHVPFRLWLCAPLRSPPRMTRAPAGGPRRLRVEPRQPAAAPRRAPGGRRHSQQIPFRPLSAPPRAPGRCACLLRDGYRCTREPPPTALPRTRHVQDPESAPRGRLRAPDRRGPLRGPPGGPRRCSATPRAVAQPAPTNVDSGSRLTELSVIR